MQAYKVLNKKSSRDAYDAEIDPTQYTYSNYPPNYPFHHPNYATYQRRDRRFYEGDYASYQQHMHNIRQG